ncbi:hypothetical protein [Ekhidna sp. To15]|uniref:hypothetical protein n=1 Tax=Ekhidna sp. To15 TaxID=3395267 RepID=UPI003F524644
MKKIITLIVSISIFLPVSGQYSQNLDTLSRKEIRKLILSQNDSEKANNLMELHQATKGLSILGFVVGAISLMSSSSPSNSQEVNIGGLMGGVLIGSGLLFTIISETAYSNSLKVYKAASIPPNPSSKVYIRNSSSIYTTIHH